VIADMKKYIAFDIGGTMVKYGIIDEGGVIIDNDEMQTEARYGGAHILNKIQGIIKKYAKVHTFNGICISTAGMVDSIKGSIIYANENIPGYTGMKVKEFFESKFGIPCEIENDVACAGLAELYSGASKGSKISICITIGTGIGACIIIDGKIFHGATNSAGEIGYMNMLNSKFENLASVSSLIEKVAGLKQCNSSELNGFKILQMAKAGDRICIDAATEMCDILGYGIANICYVINPEIVVIGGGIAREKDYLYGLIRKSMDKYLLPELGQKTKLGFAGWGNLAGLLGAYYNFREKH